MNLVNARENAFIKLVSFTNLMKDYKQKLIDLGFVPGEEIKVLTSKENGFITIMLKGTRLAIDNDSASKILVKEVF